MRNDSSREYSDLYYFDGTLHTGLVAIFSFDTPLEWHISWDILTKIASSTAHRVLYYYFRVSLVN